jgi:CDP-diacylglycerol--glycerol-3-phosphate 3-phosphatidyltransferase
VAVCFALAASLSFAGLRALGLAEPAWRWAAPVALAMGAVLVVLYRSLPDNHRRGETLLFPDLGAANAVTLARGCLLGILAGFLLLPRPPDALAWLPALVYMAAAATDFVDGYLARVTNRSTVLGQRLDIEFDSLGALLAVSLAVSYGQLPLWALLMGLARYLFVAGLAWRRWRGLPVHDLPGSIHGRIVAALFMSFVAVVLWPALDPAATRFAAIWFALPLAASFGRDWLLVSGRVDPASAAYRAALRRLQRLLTGRLPVLLRVLAAACSAALLAQALRSPQALAASLQWPGVLAPQASATLILALGLAGSIMTLLGLEARLGALLLLFPAGASIANAGLTPVNGLLLACAITLLHTGSGDLSFWRPSDRLFLQRLGRPRGPETT